MTKPPRELPVDYVGLAESLAALAYPARLELLDILRFPHAVSEVKLSPLRSPGGENPDRAASKQAVQAHLEKLADVGLVRVEAGASEGRAVNQYVVSPQALYSITEELRRLSVRYAGRGSVGDATGTLGGAQGRGERVVGTRLVLVHGVYEGKGYPLSDASAGSDGSWTIGRARGLPIALDYDPFVSLEHARVTRTGDEFVVTDLRDNKNGTLVNWEPLPKGGRHVLQPADVVGVGRSLLSFAPR